MTHRTNVPLGASLPLQSIAIHILYFFVILFILYLFPPHWTNKKLKILDELLRISSQYVVNIVLQVPSSTQYNINIVPQTHMIVYTVVCDLLTSSTSEELKQAWRRTCQSRVHTERVIIGRGDRAATAWTSGALMQGLIVIR